MTTPVSTPLPEWLVRHAGALKPGVMAETRFVVIDGRPLYKLEVRPAEGKFACSVTNTVNGKRLDDEKSTYAGTDAALAGGLEQLRNALGW